MTLLIHIIIALTSIAYASYTYVVPSKSKLRANYGLITLTVASGTYLVVTTHAPLTQSCITGLVYLGIVSAALILARHKLARRTNDIDE